MLSGILRKPSGWQAALLAVSVMFGGTVANADTPDVTNSAVVEAFVDGAVKPLMESEHSPSGVVAVMKDGKMVFAKGYGHVDIENDIPLDPKTSLVRPGSISKLFTWVSVMQLVEQGKLDPDVDVNQYLNTFKIKDTYPGQPVTLRHIMTHTAGFEDGVLGYVIINDVNRLEPLAQSMARLQPERVVPPGTRTAYSNWATAVAGLIVSNVSGVEYTDYVRRNIFDVLGMDNSTFVEPQPAHLLSNLAKSYSYKAGKYNEENYEFLSNFGPAGALSATAYDMAKFGRALMNGGADGNNRILKPATLQRMLDEGFSHDPRARGMGLGFLKREYGPVGFENFGHDGGTAYFISHFGLSKSENFMLFSSFSGPGATSVHLSFVKAFYAEFFPEDLPVITPPADFAERAQKYLGDYHSSRSAYTTIEAIMRPLATSVTIKLMPDNTLLVGEQRYVEIEKNLFREVANTGRIAFQEDDNGNVYGYVTNGHGWKQYYKPAFYETKGFITVWLGLALLAFVGVFFRLAYQWKTFRAYRGQEKNAYFATVAVAGFALLFFVLEAVALSAGANALLFELPALLKFALIFPILGTFATLYHVYMAVVIWREDLYDGRWPRIRHSVVSFFGIFTVWFYFHWNLLGFNYLS